MEGQFLGFVRLSAEIKGTLVVRDGNAPVDADSLPAFKIYGPDGVMANSTGNLAFKDPSASGGTITNATNATPIVITSAGHGLVTGQRVKIASVGGNTAANGSFTVTVVNGNSFSLNSSVGNGVYTSGGTWHASGVYSFAFTPTGGNGYAQGVTYTVIVYSTVSAVVQVSAATFCVV